MAGGAAQGHVTHVMGLGHSLLLHESFFVIAKLCPSQLDCDKPPRCSMAQLGGTATGVREVIVDKPQPSSQYELAEPPGRAGAGYLRDLFKFFMRRSTSAELADLAAWLTHECPNPLRIGTVCSGSDSPLLVLKAFESAAAEELGASSFRVQHEFSCERLQPKASFIMQMFPECQRVFRDAEEMASPSAYDWKSGGQVQVGSADMVLAGFPCTDSSRLNPRSASEAARGQNSFALCHPHRRFASPFGLLGRLVTPVFFDSTVFAINLRRPTAPASQLAP